MTHAYTSCTTYSSRPPSFPPCSFPLIRSAWTEAALEGGEGERARGVARSLARSSAQLSSPSTSPPSFTRRSLSRSFGIKSRAAPAHALSPAAVLLLLRSFSHSLSTALLPPPSSLPRISLVTSLPFPPLSIHDEIRSARNIADSSQNATITPFSAVSEGGTPTKGTV